MPPAEDDVAAIGHAIGGVFTTVEGELESFFSEGAAAIASTIKTQLPAATKADIEFVVQSALASVTAAEVTPGGGKAKMTAALVSFAALLATKGIALLETQMRAFLENTLLAFDVSKAVAAPATVAGAANAASA